MFTVAENLIRIDKQRLGILQTIYSRAKSICTVYKKVIDDTSKIEVFASNVLSLKNARDTL